MLPLVKLLPVSQANKPTSSFRGAWRAVVSFPAETTGLTASQADATSKGGTWQDNRIALGKTDILLWSLIEPIRTVASIGVPVAKSL